MIVAFPPPMKKIYILSVFLFLISFLGFAQTKSKPLLPTDSATHLITYEEVISLPNISEELIHNRVLSWFRSYFKNSGEVIRQNDLVGHVVMGKPRFKIYNPADKEGTKTDAGLIQYTITISAREGRFKYELTDFNWKQVSYYPVERWTDKSAASYTKVYEDYLRQLDEYSRALIADLKNSMLTDKPVKDKDNW
jgi:hypothetical protein